MSRKLLVVGWLLAVAGCAPATEDSAVLRGDEAFALGAYEEALAEYRLAVRQGADDAEVLARVAHTYARLGRVDDASSYYESAVAADPEMTGQAITDLMRIARDAHGRGDRFAMATAVEAARELEPALGVRDLALPLARHYFGSGEYGQALPFYQIAMAETSDAPQIVFEVGQAYEEIGDCQHALVFFERFRTMVPARDRGEVDWYIGTCSFNVAQDLRARSPEAASMERALTLVERTIELGEPRNLQARAWFEKGEILADLERCEEAMEAYAQVRYTDQAGSLVDRAQARFDEIRFGRGLESFRAGRCR